MDMDDNMILIYFNEQPLHTIPTSNHTINETLVNGTLIEDITEIHLYRAVLAFLLVILLYFCLVCHVWKEETAEAKPNVIDKSLVKKVRALMFIDHVLCGMPVTMTNR